jgi:predicted RNase H-like nuclease (RuvC/YqgF family)
MQTWLSLEEFSKITGKSKKEIISLCKQKKLVCKKQGEEVFIQIDSGNSLVPTTPGLEIVEKEASIAEKTIGMLLNLHEKVLMSKDETIKALKEENEFLKHSIYSIQEDYENQKKTIERLQKQLEITQEELEFCRRKYKLMWGQVLKKEDKGE